MVAPGYPRALATDREAPAVVFCLGAPQRFRAPAAGRDRRRGGARQPRAAVARDLRAELAALEWASSPASPRASTAARIGDRCRPRQAHARSVSSAAGSTSSIRRRTGRSGPTSPEGLLLSEAPIGSRPDRWRFPARNRIIAALSDVVVVVESRAVGGSLHTAEEAIERDIPVMAVPGSVRNPAAAGINRSPLRRLLSCARCSRCARGPRRALR